MLTFVGGNDQLIQPRGVINYYRLMATRYSKIGAGLGGDGDDGTTKVPDFTDLQSFYRLFRAPGVGHCGGGAGPQPQNLFDALVNWVENRVEPKQILAQGGAVPTRTRPLCPYPTTAIYNGSGSTDVATNFHCGGNLETFSTVCNDVVIKYKHENSSAQLDFSGTGVNRNICGLVGHVCEKQNDKSRTMPRRRSDLERRCLPVRRRPHLGIASKSCSAGR